MEDKKQVTGGVGSTGLLGVAFIVLKLCGVIDWSWLWVLAPFWIPLAVALIALAIVLMVTAVKRKRKC